jgi:probable rRNA maturation factor
VSKPRRLPADAPSARRRALEIAVVDEHGRPASAPGLSAWLRRVAPERARGRMTIALVRDARMRALNRVYRGKDYATDVLSFSISPPQRRRGRSSGKRSASAATASPAMERSLGEIAIALGVLRRQARRSGHDERTELKILALHGLLHLLGDDHERDEGRMRRVEQRLRRKGGLRESLIERAAS